MSNITPEPISATQLWLQKIVIGHNFCPFAKREFDRSSIRYVKIDSAKMDEQVSQVVAECAVLDECAEVETTLLIFVPDTNSVNQSKHYNVGRFDDFLDLTDACQWQMQRQDYEGIYQLASFHPDYCFANEPPQSPSHFTNRSPYPMLHLLREASVEKAVSAHVDAAAIPQRNIVKAEQLGADHFVQLLAAIRQS